MHKTNIDQRIRLPKLKELGMDLNYLNIYQKTWTLLKPLVFSIGFFISFYFGFYMLSALSIIALQFNTYVSSSHDLVHNTLKLTKKQNDLFLSILEILAMRSGHAFKTSHLNHHRCFPSKDDFEGKSIYKSFLGTLLSGPTYVVAIYFWSLKRCNKKDKIWIIVEGALISLYVIFSILFIKNSPMLLWYFLSLYVTSWVYPLFTVFIPHILNFEHPIFQTIKFSGPIISTLFAHHNYHLEHHLYPSVPHQNWRKLAKRLNPYLEHEKIKKIHL